MIKALSAVFIAVLLTGCEKDPEKVVETSNQSIKYDVLFSRQGCEIGRFNDSGYPVYVVICSDGSARALSTHREGKLTRHTESLTGQATDE